MATASASSWHSRVCASSAEDSSRSRAVTLFCTVVIFDHIIPSPPSTLPLTRPCSAIWLSSSSYYYPRCSSLPHYLLYLPRAPP